MSKMGLLANVRSVISSPTAYRWIIALFVLQAVFSAVVIAPSTPKDGIGGKYVERNENGVVPDGHRHLGAIYYYAERPVLAGPVISDMADDDLWMGDLVRFPSYLYYYALSFPVRVAMALHASDTAIIYVVRLIGLAIGVLALLVFRRITRLVTGSLAVQNISLLALSLTGSFVWLAAAENYDVPALLLWFAFLYVSMSLFIKKDAKYLYLMATWFFLLAVTKYTYIPFAGLFGLIAVGLYAKNNGASKPGQLTHLMRIDIKSWLGTLQKWQIALGVVLLIISAGLFTERIIGNLATYQSFNPSCKELHSHEACMKFGVYARNYNQKQRLASGTVDPIEYVPVVGYPAYWVLRYFDSMYVYMGHIYIPHYSFLIELAGIFAAIIGVLMLIFAKIKHIRIVKGQPEFYLLAVVGGLIGAQFLFNLNTILNYGGQTYAHQGRYLLSVVGFAYLLYFIIFKRVYNRQSAPRRRVTLWVGMLVALYTIVLASAIPSFLIHATHEAWYSPLAQQILPAWLTHRN